ncbi:MAG: UDP-N-acetylglucosamine 2-epimerase (non-hydrolyzing) [Armatimonadetes bacterium CG_4_10_14_0_8_um_filter_66_14]|nr:UDP-N-acetylglucosamine 2-epimerase (non-hydrolyzing) [Armatimonadota bacterium]OIO94618.1 MAG: UDP-N-acetylglucosamine 2-epimerase [Armatimonadetes bacterium CG2_30_66_41]PIW20161.1 MAG: UDP-N-acetylglucosamine 2-epimerase (non-hydrolyzing) [Armatimonadetes bacterium CG17_big_fil_post_rev_8_21_14_2_50_66_6]PIZ35153.1 MAG: UDP-N-acetylglucosamine 2-epimerase (non-hydrolyzing) [Armatimonadetes bacterium CG_4_10_14_0_8_um_filter_66_14]PJB64337.1 MAG: UDP-N-acetylglucosamine 2-epimerase (non-hy
MKILSVVGARPQFVKAGVVSRELRQTHQEILVHSGQHYDANMSEVFFDELGLPAPDENLGVGSGSHGEQTGRMLMALETCMLGHKPELVLVYGDTNSTLAGALAAAKLNLPIAHVEAGLRSFNREMPEELNRVLTDRLSALLFCPTRAAVENLADEGLTKGVSLTGDVMYDVLLQSLPAARERTQVGRELGLRRGEYVVVTVHRASNTDEPGNLAAIVEALTRIEHQVAFPLHPRTRSRLQSAGMLGRLQAAPNVHVLDPLGYLEMLALMDAAGKILTDSGGVQKEAFLLGVPCVTMRRDTEWVETVESGWNTLTGPDTEAILRAIAARAPTTERGAPYGEGNAAAQIREEIDRFAG